MSGAGDLDAATAPSTATDPGDARGLRVVDPWEQLRTFTPARIGLGRAGDALATKDQLELRLAHAQARDAVHAALDVDELRAKLGGREVIHVRSAARDRAQYLQRPDLGRQLADGEADRFGGTSTVSAAIRFSSTPMVGPDVAFVVADGLSPLAVQHHAAPMVQHTIDQLPEWTVAPIVVATQARVALGDPIGEALGAQFVVVLVGERPGLSAADSLGIYLTFQPRMGRRDSERNCISNVRPPIGLSYAAAAHKLATLMREARRRGLTGVDLKDDGPALEA